MFDVLVLRMSCVIYTIFVISKQVVLEVSCSFLR